MWKIGGLRMLDDKDVVRLLRSEVEQAGGQSAWARRERIDRALLNRVLCSHKSPTAKIIRALKLCHVYASDGAEDRREECVDSDPSTERSAPAAVDS
jgi:hypothetical protein